MTETLYSREVLRLAASIPHHSRLKSAAASIERRSPVCGSRVVVDALAGADGSLTAIGLEVKACALGQASASLMAAHAIGRTPSELAEARDFLGAYLRGERDDPGAWPGLSVFAAARKHSARHAAILLAFEAAAEAAAIAARADAA